MTPCRGKCGIKIAEGMPMGMCMRCRQRVMRERTQGTTPQTRSSTIRICEICSCEFKSVRPRACCSSPCEAKRQYAVKKGYRVGVLTSLKMAETRHDSRDEQCKDWLHERIANWYSDRYRERVSEGISPPVPLPIVLECHKQGAMASVPDRVMRELSVMEDAPGSWSDDQESDDDE